MDASKAHSDAVTASAAASIEQLQGNMQTSFPLAFAYAQRQTEEPSLEAF